MAVLLVEELHRMLNRFGLLKAMILCTLGIVAASVVLTMVIVYIMTQRFIPFAALVAALCPLMLSPPVTYLFLRLIMQLKQANTELSLSMAQVKELKGMLPICASCKKIRDDEGYWQHIESYISKHTHAVFSHSICSDCHTVLYGDLLRRQGNLPGLDVS